MVELNSAKAPINDGADANAGLVVLALTTPFQLVGLSADNGQTAARVEMER